MKTFRQRLEEIAERLDAHPEINLLDLNYGDPADPERVRAAMRGIGMGCVDESMVAFYARHNGAYLEWQLDGVEAREVGFGGWPEDYGTSPGCINILGYQEVFSPGWQQDYITQHARDEHWLPLYGTTRPEDLAITTGVLDFCSTYYHTDVIFGPKLAVLVSSDHGADLGCSDFMTFEQYLDVVLARHGSNAYFDVGIGWTRQGRWLEQVPTHTLGEVIAQVRADLQEE